MVFLRHDTWSFVHGSGGWLLDTLRVNDKVLTATVLNGLRINVIDSKYDADSGRVTFDSLGYRLAWHPTGIGG